MGSGSQQNERHQADGPSCGDEEALAIAPVTRARQEGLEAEEIGDFEHIHPFRQLLHAFGHVDVVTSRDGGRNLEQCGEEFGLALHTCFLPQPRKRAPRLDNRTK